MITENINPETGIRYGYIAANSLDPELVDKLQCGPRAENMGFRLACEELEDALWMVCDGGMSNRAIKNLIEYATDLLNDEWEDEEPIHAGTLDGVTYRTSWCGGALHVWVLYSPISGRYALCSPCVPNAGNLDRPDEDGELTYDVPEYWRVDLTSDGV